eukprot:884605-Rhodomonas_salina.3
MFFSRQVDTSNESCHDAGADFPSFVGEREGLGDKMHDDECEQHTRGKAVEVADDLLAPSLQRWDQEEHAHQGHERAEQRAQEAVAPDLAARRRTLPPRRRGSATTPSHPGTRTAHVTQRRGTCRHPARPMSGAWRRPWCPCPGTGGSGRRQERAGSLGFRRPRCGLLACGRGMPGQRRPRLAGSRAHLCSCARPCGQASQSMMRGTLRQPWTARRCRCPLSDPLRRSMRPRRAHAHDHAHDHAPPPSLPRPSTLLPRPGQPKAPPPPRSQARSSR